MQSGSNSNAPSSSNSSPALKIKDPFLYTRQVCRKCTAEEFQQCLQSLSSSSSQGEKKEESDETLIYSKLFTFKFESTEKELLFPTSLSSKQRKLVHTISESLNLEHNSFGLNENRYIAVSRKGVDKEGDDNTISEFYHIKGYIGLSGMAVSAVAKLSLQFVPEPYVANQQIRDGREHHITILSEAVVSTQSTGEEQIISTLKACISFVLIISKDQKCKVDPIPMLQVVVTVVLL
eukprot:TRINITY_DN4437_c0_g2_i1.p1 TRINITY_DN4437_c0_g2~~TRINITY_DN4437_c0_g2_i1.p1  ORF type:complete len:235 (+),score=46.01 TRINITY_DN4437_c0_g2_i1:121-825(+)